MAGGIGSRNKSSSVIATPHFGSFDNHFTMLIHFVLEGQLDSLEILRIAQDLWQHHTSSWFESVEGCGKTGHQTQA